MSGRRCSHARALPLPLCAASSSAARSWCRRRRSRRRRRCASAAARRLAPLSCCLPPAACLLLCLLAWQAVLHLRAVGGSTQPPCSQLRLPQAKQAVEAAARAAEKAAKGGAAPALEDDSNEETDPTKYYENRVRAVVAAKARGENPYPHKFHVSIQLPAYVAKYGGLEAGQQAAEETVSLAGRVVRKAASGAKLIFFDLRSEGAKIQVMCDAR